MIGVQRVAATGTDPAVAHRVSRGWRALAALLLLATATSAVAVPAAAQGSATVDTNGAVVTVTVVSTPGFQVRVELPDGAIVSTALVGPDGSAQMMFELASGDYELEVILFDFAGTPMGLGTHNVHIAGPPPGAPTVVVTPGTAADNRTLFQISGLGGSHFEIEATREGSPPEATAGDLAADGTGQGALVLASGDWNYAVTLSTDGGASAPSTASVHVELGPPPAPVVALASPPGVVPVTIGVIGPANGRVVVTATLDERTVTGNADLDIDGAAQVDLQLRDDGTWTISVTAFDIEERESPATTLEGGALVSRDGPPLKLELIGSGGGQFAYRVVTDVGVQVSVTSETPALRQTFTAEEEETEFRIDVPDGNHVIEVTAVDELGNATRGSLSSDEGGAGSNWTVLALIVLALAAGLAVLGYVNRQEIIDWWNTRQYH